MTSCTQKHAANEVRGRNAGSPLHHLETACCLDETIAVLAAAVRRDVIAVNDVFAPEMTDPSQVSHIWRIWDALCGPPASIYSRNAIVHQNQS